MRALYRAEKAADMKNNNAIDTSELDSRQFPTTVALRRKINQIKRSTLSGVDFPAAHVQGEISISSETPFALFTLTSRRSVHNLMSVALRRDEMGHLHLQRASGQEVHLANTMADVLVADDECTEPSPAGRLGHAD